MAKTRALELGTYPISSATFFILKAVAGDIDDHSFKAFDTVEIETPASFATSFIETLTFAASENTELINFSNVSRDIGMSADTIKEWYQILVDTFIGYYLRPYRKGTKRIPVNTSKFYFFDVGVARAAARMAVPTETMTEYGKMFENFIFTELKAYIDYNLTDDELYFWRTREGYEVDFVVERKVAIEVKTLKNITNKELKGLRAFMEENAVKDYIIVCRELFERTTDDGIKIIPWTSFLDKLWNGEIFH